MRRTLKTAALAAAITALPATIATTDVREETT